MKEENSEKFISVVLFLTLVCIFFLGARYIDNLKSTVTEYKNKYNESEERKRAVVENMRQFKNDFRLINDRYNILAEDSRRTANELGKTKLAYNELKSNYKEVESINKQLREDKLKLTETITRLSERTSESSVGINAIRSGLERQSGCIDSITATITEIERNNKLEAK